MQHKKRVCFFLMIMLCFVVYVKHGNAQKLSADDDKKKIETIFGVSTYSARETYNILLADIIYFSSYKNLPVHPAFKELEAHPEVIASIDQEALYATFLSEVYQPLPTSFIEEKIKKHASTLLTAYQRCEVLNKNWGFVIFPCYSIYPLFYGPGGGYRPDTGGIELNVNDKGLRKKTCETIIHEMVHIGIENAIVQRFQLSHWEKEGLVDTICSLYFHDLLPNYHMQSSGDKNIQKLTYEALVNDLPGAIAFYKKLQDRFPTTIQCQQIVMCQEIQNHS